MVLNNILVLFLHDYSGNVRLDRPDWLQLLCLLPKLIEAKEIMLEALSLETLPERVLLAWNYVETQMPETFLNFLLFRVFTE